MSDCLILGDSIAVGIGQMRRDCTTVAVSGIGSADFLARYGDKAATESRVVVVSLGSNDHIVNVDALVDLRRRLRGQRVIWVLPAAASKAWTVATVALSAGDAAIPIPDRADHAHPTAAGYRKMGEAISYYCAECPTKGTCINLGRCVSQQGMQ